jgi:hypothetical protein
MAWAEAWFAKAKRQNPGVGDPRPETLAALEALVRSLREDAKLRVSGRIASAMDCGRTAGQHLLIERAIGETPEIVDTEIPAPIFLIGWMRTGTTFVHRLLAQDPETRTMPYWESMYPVPPRRGKDDRPEELARVLKQLESLSPNYEAIHPMGACEPEGCVALFTNVFRTLQYSVQYRVPGYIEWLQGQDPHIAYGQYRQQLQLVQYHRPHGVRFALKDPTHSVFLDTILELFPSARRDAGHARCGGPQVPGHPHSQPRRLRAHRRRGSWTLSRLLPTLRSMRRRASCSIWLSRC